ncbi:MAG: SLC13 family permease [Acidobacteriota bacterium]
MEPSRLKGQVFPRHRRWGLPAGPFCFLLLLVLPWGEGLPWPARCVLATTIWMAVWWTTEAVHLAVTALVPIPLFPLLGVAPAGEVTASYADQVIYLYVGGFLIAAAMERWKVHRRLALLTIQLTGVGARRLLLGFMGATAALSMWISNTATAMMMLPIVLAVLSRIEEDGGRDRGQAGASLGRALTLGVAYAASIGGIATLVGTPPNAVFAGVLEQTLQRTVSFWDWLEFAFPVSLAMFGVAWVYLAFFVLDEASLRLDLGMQAIREELRGMGPWRREEKWVLGVFGCVAAAWILRGLVPLPERLGGVQDSTIAMVGALALFLIPSSWKKGEFLLDWKTAVQRIPWDIVLLFGGGFALAHGFYQSGLTRWIGERMTGLSVLGPWLLMAVAIVLVILLTEVTSNTATASIILPIAAGLGDVVQVPPEHLMATITVAASLAFMLPVATPPNAIAFSTRRVTIPEMARAGLAVDGVGVLVLLLFARFWLPWVW